MEELSPIFPETHSYRGQILRALITQDEGIMSPCPPDQSVFRLECALQGLIHAGWPIEQTFVDLNMRQHRLDWLKLPVTTRTQITRFLDQGPK